MQIVWRMDVALCGEKEGKARDGMGWDGVRCKIEFGVDCERAMWLSRVKRIITQQMGLGGIEERKRGGTRHHHSFPSSHVHCSQHKTHANESAYTWIRQMFGT